MVVSLELQHDDVVITITGACASAEVGTREVIVKLSSLEATKTLRDALSAFIAFHEPLPEIDQSAHFVPTEEQLQDAAERFIEGAS